METTQEAPADSIRPAVANGQASGSEPALNAEHVHSWRAHGFALVDGGLLVGRSANM
jgi:hypothetical protein